MELERNAVTTNTTVSMNEGSVLSGELTERFGSSDELEVGMSDPGAASDGMQDFADEPALANSSLEEDSVEGGAVVNVEAETLAEETVTSAPSQPPKTLARTETGIESARTDDPLAVYMREVRRHPLLTREEEHQLAVLYHESGDVEAAKKLVTSNLRLVVKIAHEYKRAHKNMMDLVQEGNIGLMQAVKRYDPHRGVKLSSYSAWWIRAYILRFILNNWRLVKLGTTQAQRKLFFNLNKERARLAAMGIEPTHEEIAKRLDVGKKEVQEMDLRLSSNDASLDVPVGDGEGKQTSRLELLPSETEGPDSLVEHNQLLEMLRENLDVFRTTLEGKDLDIFNQRMIAEEPMTLQQLGDEFGVSRERVRQLEARINGKLRKFLLDSLGDPTPPQEAQA